MNLFNDLKIISILLLLVAGLSACNDPGPAETAGKNIDQTLNKAGQSMSDAADKTGEAMSKQSDKAGVAIDDTEITTRVKAAILGAPGLDSMQISVDTVSGVVTLSGTVDSVERSDMANNLAEAVSGVHQVNNHLEVSPN